MPFFNLNCWPTIFIFFLAGIGAAGFAFVSVNLFSRANACMSFIGEYGMTAFEYGAFWQVVELVVWGAVTLTLWLVFKVSEDVLVARYIAWTNQESQACRQTEFH